MSEGTNCPTTMIAQRPKKMVAKIPLLSSLAPEAANALVTGMTPATVPMMVAKVLMASSFLFHLNGGGYYIYTLAANMPKLNFSITYS
jgi:enoyl reductase-like protein